MKLLLVNPNTTEAMTDGLRRMIDHEVSLKYVLSQGLVNY